LDAIADALTDVAQLISVETERIARPVMCDTNR
jgi:hypothetical protein